MTASPSDHPEYSTEDHHLRSTLAALEARIAEVGAIEPHGPTAHDTDSLIRRLREVYENLQIAREQVYFGRLDLGLDGAADIETHYLGRIGFDRNGKIIVVDWRAPMARLFSRRRPGPAQYHSPDGSAGVHLQLKRHLTIQADNLLGLHDAFDTRPTTRSAETRPGLVDPDAFLRDVLSGRREAQLQDIVATIQEHQDDLIRADPKQVLVVQGVAGSGKTSIALHRVAFLLYPGNKTGIEAERCIIFGPNQLFLDYVANVLPGLGVKGIAQTMLDAWALDRLGLVGHPMTDATLEALLSHRTSEAEKQARARRSQLKASLRMGRVLENFVEWWRTRLSFPSNGFTYRNLGPLKVAVSLTQARAHEIHRSLVQLPLAHHRRRFQETAFGELMGAYTTATLREADALTDEGKEMSERSRKLQTEAAQLEQYAAFAKQNGDAELEASGVTNHLEQGANGLRSLADFFRRQGERLVLRAARLKDETEKGEHHSGVRATVQKALETDLEKAWPALDPLAAYPELLSDSKRLSQLGKGLLTADEIALLNQSMPPTGDTLEVGDLPALCYLHTLIYGVPAPLYDHVVVDEAQDVAPLYFAALKRFSRNGSFTILGDLAQGVYAYRGIAEWDDVRRVFEGAPYSYHETSESYRSTHEIITFANGLLELLTPAGGRPRLAKPFERHGVPIHIQQLARSESIIPEAINVLAHLQAEGYQNIALIAKTFAHCTALAQDLRAQGFESFQAATAGENHYAGGVFILPVHLAKGMEFEAVLIVNADDQTYSSSEFDGRLLYVAATRALHVLHILAGGIPNIHVELARTHIT